MKFWDRIKDDKYSDIIGVALVAVSLVLMAVSAYTIAAKTDINVVYTGDKWYESHDMALPQLPETELPDNTRLSPYAVSENYIYGNEPQLCAMDAAVCSDDESYYMADPARGDALCRINKKDFSDCKALTDLPVRDVNVCGDKLFFSTAAKCSGKDQGIYCIGTDGNNLRILSKGDFYDLQLMNDRLYYIRANDRHIYRLDINGRGEILLSDEECIQLLIVNTKLYYLKRDRSGDTDNQFVICCMDADGDGKDNVIEFGKYSAFSYYDGKLVYVVYDEGYGMIDISDKETVSYNNARDSFIRLKGIESLPVMNNEQVIYIDRSSGNMLTVFDTSNSERYSTSFTDVLSFYTVDDLIVIKWLNGDACTCVTACNINSGKSIELFGAK